MALSAIEEAYVDELYRRLTPGATRAYNNHVLDRTRRAWQTQMRYSLLGTGVQDAGLPAYEKAYVLELYNQLLPGAGREYTAYIMTRTPAPWQESMATRIVNFNLSNDSDVQSWVIQMTIDGGQVTDLRQKILSQFFRAEKTAGVFALTDDYWLYSGENQTQARRSLKARRLITEVATPTWIANYGYRWNGTGSCVNTNFVPSTMATQLKTTGGRIEGYVPSSNQSNTFILAARSSTNVSVELRSLSNSGQMGGALASSFLGIALVPFVVAPQVHGFVQAQRVAGAAVTYYRNNALVASGNAANFDQLLVALPLYCGAENVSGTIGSFAAQDLSYCAIGDDLDATQRAAHFNAVRTLIAACMA